MQHKVVTLEGSEVTFAGRAGDPYFDDLGHHDNAMLVDALRLLPSDAMILDVGANIGFTTAVMTKRLPNARIFSFEPDSEPFGYLRETVRLNNFSKVETVNKALAAAPVAWRSTATRAVPGPAIWRAISRSATATKPLKSRPWISSAPVVRSRVST